MAVKNQKLESQYKNHPLRIKAISEFKKSNNYSEKPDVKQYMCQFMAVLGLELENRFPSFVTFEDESFILFGREKSKKSTENKKKLNIQEFDQKFQDAIEKNATDQLPTEVRSIYDYYAFKLVCPEIKQPREIINTVILDILSDIEMHSPQYAQQVANLKENIADSHFTAIDFINNNFSDTYPGLKDKLIAIMKKQQIVNKTQEFIDSTSLDVSSLTLSEYYSKIIECYRILIELSYEESVEEYVRIAQEGIKAREKFAELTINGGNDNTIALEKVEKYNKKLQELLDYISRKKSNKLDLALGDLMVFDILTTSKAIKNLNVDFSKDPTRTKHKRMPNGYIAEFYSLDMLNDLTAEIQLQSAYRYTDGESGPAAHSKMENGIKKRTFYEIPHEKGEYKEWAKKQFESLPKYFKYLGHGLVQEYSTLQNFKRYYDCENSEDVQSYVKFIVEHDIDLLDSEILSFSLDDESILINQENELSNDDNSQIR